MKQSCERIHPKANNVMPAEAGIQKPPLSISSHVLRVLRIVFVLVGATVVCAGAALATQTAQEKCDQARVTAWKTYVACIDTVVAKDAGCTPSASCPASFSTFAAFAKCRHTYFKNWTAFQAKSSLTGSTCIAGSRFTSTDSGWTVTDALTGLVWDRSAAFGSTIGGQWSQGSPWKENGSFWVYFQRTYNLNRLSGSNGWRLPTLAELQSIVLDFPCAKSSCSCGSNPCIDATFAPTQSDFYWSATGYVPSPDSAWIVNFLNGDMEEDIKPDTHYVRIVRGGL